MKSPKSYSRRLLVCCIALLVLAVGLQLVPKRDEPHYVPKGALLELAPTSVAGWEVKDRPLGDTEAMNKEVQGILGYEQAFFRVYRRGNTEVGLYVAYWGSRMEMHPMDAATHTPDLCWINAGWREQSHDYELELQDGTGRALKPAQFRVFTAETARQEVVFWHLMGGRLSGYALGPSNRWKARLPILWENQLENWFGLKRREQYFIRISTNTTIAELKADPLWREIIKTLAPTGLLEGEGA